MTLSIPTFVHAFISSAAVACIAAGISEPMKAQSPRPVGLVLEQTIVGDGVANPDATMNEARHLARLPDGSLLVAEAERIMQFSPKGEFVRSIGRSGSGPGEFGRIDRIGFANDSVWIVDQLLKRISWIRWGGTGARTDRFPQPTGPHQVAFFHQPLAGAFGLSKRWSTDSTVRVRLVIHDSTGKEIRVLSEEERGASGTTVTLPAGRYAVPQPFATTPLFAVSPNAAQVALVLRDDQSLAIGGATLVQRYQANGTLIRQFTAMVQPRRISSRMRDSVVDAIVAAHTRVALGGRVVDQSALHAAVRAAVRVPDVVPAFRDVIATDEGSVWLQLSGPPNTWRIVSSAGVPLGDVTFPLRTIVKLATERDVWVLQYDDDDVPVLRLYRLDFRR